MNQATKNWTFWFDEEHVRERLDEFKDTLTEHERAQLYGDDTVKKNDEAEEPATGGDVAEGAPAAKDAIVLPEDAAPKEPATIPSGDAAAPKEDDASVQPKEE